MDVKVSVIVPVYNVEKYLRESLDSVINQTCRDIEIICVDDGSTDSSPAILEEYAAADSRFVLFHQENLGVSEARNTGAKNAHGKYLFFLDGDDYLDPSAMEILSSEMERRDLEYLCFNAAAFGDTRKEAEEASKMNLSYLYREMDETRLFTGQELIREFFSNPKNHLVAAVWTSMISRSFFLEHGLWFYPGIIHEDELWSFSVLMKAKRCGCLNRRLYRYRIREGSITHLNARFRSAYSLFICVREAQKVLYAADSSIEEGMEPFIRRYIERLQKKAVRQYRACRREDKDFTGLPLGEQSQFERIVVYPSSLEDRIAETEARRMDAENKRKKTEQELTKKITKLTSSKTFRIGRCITWLPRMMKRAFKKLTRVVAASKPNRIRIRAPFVQDNRIKYQYQLEGPWKQYFNVQEDFDITFPFSVEKIPESILIIPFLSQILPVAWICNARIHVPSCDRAFINCLDKVKAGYRKMYPMLTFRGRLSVGRLEDNRFPASEAGRPLVCFSGGVDALSTTLSHLEESPVLVSLWGSDVPAVDEGAWKTLDASIEEEARLLGLDRFVVRSSFRKLLVESKLEKLVKDSGDGWWHGFQHGLGLLGHMAPIAWENRAGVVYIASSFTEYDHATCASDPSIDNHVRFAAARVIHDGYDKNRQEKVGNILRYADENSVRFPLHVCWEKKNGENCCHCEKCWRTMLGIFLEGGDPREYGFPHFTLSSLSDDLESQFERFSVNAVANYGPIQTCLRRRFTAETCPKELTWLYSINLNDFQDRLLKPHNGTIRRIVWLLGTPEHGNLGDQCIAEAELDYLRTQFPDFYVREISSAALKAQNYRQLDKVSPSQLVLLQGGGNMGTLWPGEETRREEIITRLSNPIVVFPQSIFFSDDKEGKDALTRAEKVYQGNNLRLFCRDKSSYAFAQEHFTCRSVLIPDCVLWEGRTGTKKVDRFGAMTLFRNDKERVMDESARTEIYRFLAAAFHSLDVYDTLLTSGTKISPDDRRSKTQALVDRITSVECVVTDRLHGMILCAVTGTPCVVFGNSYHKIESGYQWIRDLEYIRFIHTVDELEDAVASVCAAKDKSYPEAEMRRLYAPLDNEIRNCIATLDSL